MNLIYNIEVIKIHKNFQIDLIAIIYHILFTF